MHVLSLQGKRIASVMIAACLHHLL